MKKRKSVILFGKTSVAVQILDYFLARPDDYQILCVVPVNPTPDYENESFKDYALARHVTTIISGNPADIPGVMETNWSVDLAISIFYDKIFKPWFINKCKKMINIHLSFLPKYRGTRSINWALKNEERFHGVTIHEITEGLDNGPIISQMQFSIFPEFQEVRDVYQATLKYAYILFCETIPHLDKIKPILQDEYQASYYSSKDNHKLKERLTFTKALSQSDSSYTENT